MNGAIREVMGLSGCAEIDSDPYQAVEDYLRTLSDDPHLAIPTWNDESADDFEVIDALRLAAKNIRNEAVA